MSAALREARRYHSWVFASFAAALRPGAALEVGSGHGRYSRLLAARVTRLFVSDIDPLAVAGLRAELRQWPNVDCLVMDGIDSTRLPPVDNVVLVNLLEHVADDRGLLLAAHQALSPGGALILFVPAFAALYSRMDREAGHHRRYGRAELWALVEGAGFRVVRCRLFNAVGFFGWYANKLLGSAVNSAATNAQVSLYDRLVPVIKHFDPLMPFVGQSIVLIAHKRG